MPTDVYLNGKKVTLDPDKRIGEGHEAEVYDIGYGQALLVFKDETHPDNAGNPCDEETARERLEIMQRKLCSLLHVFPATLRHITQPQEIVTNQTGTRLLGYTMQYLKDAEPLTNYAGKRFRREKGISNNTVMEIFRSLHKTVSELHHNGIVIGDFQPDNVFDVPCIIDTHSFQFGNYLCWTCKPEFVDPLLCDSTAKDIRMIRPHNKRSDWYAYTAMLMQSLVLSHPYGGAYQTLNPAKRVPEHLRPLHRITVFHPDVRYDRDAVSYSVLPYELLRYFQEVFEEDRRGVFPVSLLDIHWRTCDTCGTEIARPECPVCFLAK